MPILLLKKKKDLCLLYPQGFALDFSELREYTHGFFSNVAEIMDDGFTQVELQCYFGKLSVYQ